MADVKTLFPNFSKELIAAMEQYAVIQQFKPGDILIRTGQYRKNTALVTQGKIKIYR
jgi:CRP/FNR family transcriptional regulator